ncbi:MAG: hypothetical protein KF912_15145 [Phycisphaeraceae bacterium]|nr:hypothetical protein [Phycisphaeraceae bacterium]MBX3368643.1 hypothetical protein [Phycisphaeraceae bacterium]
MAGLVTVRYSDHFEEDLIVNHNDVLIAGFTPELTTASIDMPLHNSMRFSFRPSGEAISAMVSGNILPLYPSEPFQTVALCYDGGLDQLGTTLSASRGWVEPFFDLETGAVGPASLATGDLKIDTILNNGYGYVGYATSDLSMFGYMQIQRLSLYEWRLIGYAYDDSGAPVTVQDIVPSGASLTLLSASAVLGGRKRRPLL